MDQPYNKIIKPLLQPMLVDYIEELESMLVEFKGLLRAVKLGTKELQEKRYKD